MQGYCTDVKSAYKYRDILIVSRMHAASLIPWRKECTASHRGNNLSILLVHAGNIAFTGQAEPVRIHGLCRACHTGFKYILKRLAGSMQVFIV